MQFNIRTGNYAQAGKAAADDAVRSFAAARRNAPDYGKMAQQAQEIRSKTKIEGIKAATAVTKTGVQAAGDIESLKIKESAKRDLASAKRMAGALATGGKLIATAGTYMGDSGRTKREVGANDSYFDGMAESNQTKLDELRSQLDDLNAGVDTTVPSNHGGTGTVESNASTPTQGTGGTASGNSASLPSAQSGGSTAMKLMTDLTSDGYTPVQAAAIVGNAQYESANFTAHEEFSPNAYGTKGAGFFQWTNAGGSNRRDQFESFASSRGLDPTSYAANTGYMMHEMKGGSGNHWTGGMNDDSFRQINDLPTAVNAFQNNYLRPAAATANNSQRQANAQSIYQQWMNQQ